jgi:hypothetical protein
MCTRKTTMQNIGTTITPEQNLNTSQDRNGVALKSDTDRGYHVFSINIAALGYTPILDRPK